jgi:hypothetical protein
MNGWRSGDRPYPSQGDIFMVPSDDVDYPQKNPYRLMAGTSTMVQKVLAMEEGPKRDEFSKVVASYMKLAYRMWGKEQFVNDELIKKTSQNVGGKIDVSDEANIDSYRM